MIDMYHAIPIITAWALCLCSSFMAMIYEPSGRALHIASVCMLIVAAFIVYRLVGSIAGEEIEEDSDKDER